MNCKRLILPSILLLFFLTTIACMSGMKQIHTEPIPMTDELLIVAEQVCSQAFIELEYIGEGNWYQYKYMNYPTDDEYTLCASYAYFQWSTYSQKD